MPPIMHTPNTAPQPGPCRPLCNVIITSCSAAPPGNCSGPHKFKCGSGECKLIRFRCNGHNQCDDGSDENNCCKLMVVVTVVVVVVGQSNTLKSFFFEFSVFLTYPSTTDKSNLAVERFEDEPLVEFMYLVFTRMSGELPQATQVFVVVLLWRLWSCVLMLQKVLRLGVFCLFAVFVSLLCKLTTSDIDHSFLFAFLYHLLMTQSFCWWLHKIRSCFPLQKATLSIKKQGHLWCMFATVFELWPWCSGFDSCVKYKSAFPSFFFFLIARTSHEFVTKLEQSWSF